jgi:hypothetical protein
MTPALPGPYTFSTGQPVQVVFNVTGDVGKRLAAGVAQGPTGARVQLTPGKLTFFWDMPVAGTQTFKVLLRNLDSCAQIEVANPSLCPIPVAATTPVTVGLAKPYDIVSESLSLTVSATGTGTGIGTGTGTGGTSGLIGTISGLMGGGDLSGLLGGLSGGQLSQILSQIQGGGMDMGSLIAMVGGMSAPADSDGDSEDAGD